LAAIGTAFDSLLTALRVRIKSFPGIGRLTRAAGAHGGAPASRLSLWFGLVLVILCAVYASHSRLAQRAAWQTEPEQYFASGVPMMTTLDAYYTLRLARLHAAGKFTPWGPVPARHYARPEQGDPNTWYDQREPKVLPLLSRVLAEAATFFHGDIDEAALVLSPLLSSLFMVPLFWYCWRLGVPAAGLMGGLAATFCLEYYRRTSVGWIDTDCLNLFFPWTISCLILAMHREQRRQTLLLLSAAAGAVLYAFDLWYGKPVLTLAYLCALVIHLSLAGVSWRRIVLCTVTLAVFANPVPLGNVLGSAQIMVHRYLWPSAETMTNAGSAVHYPQVWSTISEAQRLTRSDTLKQILPRADMAAIGLSVFALFAAWRWRAMAALSPMVLLGALALLSSRRFIPYLAPFVGIGCGLIISAITRALLDRPGRQSDQSALVPQTSRSGQWLRAARSFSDTPTLVAYIAVVVVFFVWLAPTSGTQVSPRPAIPAPVFRDLQILAKQLPANSRMWTWWDNGFAIVDATGFGVYHDGAAQYTPQTNLIAASFVESDPGAMHRIIGFVDREGNRGIRRLAAAATDLGDLLGRVRRASPPPLDAPVYVLYTPDMLLSYPAMRFLGGWDQRTRSPFGSIGIRWLQCERLVDDNAYCAGRVFDLRTGLIERQSVPSGDTGEWGRLRRAVVVEGGRIVRQRDYADTGGGAQFTMEIVLSSGKVAGVYLLDEPAFESNLNQMFVLGRFDGELFEEVYNDVPFARAFRVRAGPR
jgi:undecaprenyl-diphosphooligosaccharide---protein glycotransferase